MSMDHRTRVSVLAIAVALGVCAVASADLGAIDFLVPGMSLESVSLVPGSRVSYLVTSQSFGATDSSYVELRVIDRAGGAFRLEILSSPYPRSKEGSTTIRIRLAERVTSAATSEEFRSCLEEIRIREGAEAFRSPTQKELDDLDIEGLFVRANDHSERRALEQARIATPAGSFLCDGVEISRKETRQVSLGGVQAERTEEMTSRLWLSREVPLWGLVKSRIEKTDLTRSSAARSGGETPRVTVTESILLSYRRPRGHS
jgi:hypothetical protein